MNPFSSENCSFCTLKATFCYIISKPQSSKSSSRIDPRTCYAVYFSTCFAVAASITRLSLSKKDNSSDEYSILGRLLLKSCRMKIVSIPLHLCFFLTYSWECVLNTRQIRQPFFLFQTRDVTKSSAQDFQIVQINSCQVQSLRDARSSLLNISASPYLVILEKLNAIIVKQQAPRL